MTTKRPLKKAPAEKAGVVEGETQEKRIERKRLEARLRAAERAKKERAWLEKSVAGSGRLRGRPTFYVRPAWELMDDDMSRFNRVYGISDVFNQIKHKVHVADRELVFNAIGGTMAFHQLTRLIDDIDFDESWDEHRWEIEHIRIGFELTLQALDRALCDRGVVLEGLSKGGKNRGTPAWHDKCINAAKALLEAGVAPHELAGKLAPRFERDRKTIRVVLKKAGIK